jgi:lysozyme
MKTNALGRKLIQHYESLMLEAYQCSAKKWTIGYGNTFYEDGTPVKKGDKITVERAESLFDLILDKFEKEVSSLLTRTVTEDQFSALVSFAYNVGSDIDADTIAEGLGDSTLLKMINRDPNDPKIADEFLKWNKETVNGVKKPSLGLTRRRKSEAHLYFNFELKYFY